MTNDDGEIFNKISDLFHWCSQLSREGIPHPYLVGVSKNFIEQISAYKYDLNQNKLDRNTTTPIRLCLPHGPIYVVCISS